MVAVSVMFFMPVLDGGGAEMNVVRLAKGLMRHGVQPTYVVARGPGRYAEHLPPEAKVVVLDTGSIDSSTLRLARSILPLARLIDERRPDIVCPILHSPSFVAIAAARLARHRPKVALSVQNTLEPPASAERRLAERIEESLVNRIFPKADSAIALSHGVAGDLARSIPELKDRIDVVHNAGLPLPSQIAAFEPNPPPPKAHSIRFLTCGRLTEQKGYPFLLDAFRRVAGLVDAELHVLGDGALRRSLEARCHTLGITDRVTFLGFRSNPFIHMREADVFVLSSLWEGFANVVVEAMSMGVAVIATDCPHGPAEIITPGLNGLLVPPANSEALAEAMLCLARDAELRDRLAAQGVVRARDFAPDSIAAKYAAIFIRMATPDR